MTKHARKHLSQRDGWLSGSPGITFDFENAFGLILARIEESAEPHDEARCRLEIARYSR